MPTTLKVLRPGDTSKPNPYTIVIVANPALEAPWKSGEFVIDPIMADQPAFDACAQYTVDALFGALPNQRERLMAEPAFASRVRIVSLFVTGLPAIDANSLVAQDSLSFMLIARRDQFNALLAQFGLVADVSYAISKSDSHTRASAWFTTDDDTRAGISFTLDGVALSHRFFCRIPGTVAMHTTAASLTALHEFGHAASSYTNGAVVDLYVDGSPGLNNKRGRPIPTAFANHNGVALTSDLTRDSLGYPSDWQSYHCELIDSTFLAVMDNYWLARDRTPEHCQHDLITRRFLIERLRAKMSR